MRSLIFILLSLIAITPPNEGVRWHKNFIFVVDVSGSMSPEKSSKAIEAVMQISQQPIDEMEMKVIAFDSDCLEWPNKWAKLPDAEAIENAKTFLKQTNLDWMRRKGTKLGPALKRALADPKRALSVVVISDGMFMQESTKELLTILETGQAAREVKATVSFVSVTDPSSSMMKLSKVAGGGLFQMVK